MISAIIVLHIALAKALHQHAGAFRRGWGQQQMNVIVHQAPGMDRAVMLSGLIRKVLQIEQVVSFREETGRAIIPPLYQVHLTPGNSARARSGIWKLLFHGMAPENQRRPG
jgi:hypothetical protein